MLGLSGGCGDSESDREPTGGAGSQGSGGSNGGDSGAGASDSAGSSALGGSSAGGAASVAGAGGETPGSGGAPAGEGGAAAGGAPGVAGSGGSGDPFLEHCALAEVESGSICLENVIAQAGDAIDVEIWLLLPAGCDWSTQFAVTFDYDADNLTFEDDPIEDFYDGAYQCVSTPAQDAGTYAFGKFSASALSNCPEQFTPGLHGILRATVAADATPADYALTITAENVGDNLTQSPDCRSQADQMHWHGLVRVVE